MTNTYVRRRSGALQVRLDGAVLLVEERHVRDKVLDNIHVGKRVDARLLGGVRGNTAQAGQGVDTVDVHGAATADTLTATPPESKGRIDLVLNADERIQHHRSGLVQVEGVRLHLGLRGRLIGVPSVDVEGLCLRILLRLRLVLGRCLALRRDLARGVWIDGLGDLRDRLAGDRVSDGGETTREDCWAKGCVRASAGLNGAYGWYKWDAYLSAS